MENYSVSIYGDNLLVDNVIENLKEISPKKIYKKGNDYHIKEGEKKKNRGSKFNKTNIIYFDDGNKEFFEFLVYLKDSGFIFNKCNVDEINILMNRVRDKNDQINGELSCEEMKIMSELNATYCWSVV